jgi:primosomal protein N' (replication factor Y) (superfamily II helicase)
MFRYADVAIPAGVDKTFTYTIPEALVDSALPGMRVLVPFGRKFLTGIIVGLPARSSHPSLRPLADVLDVRPAVSDHMLRLCRWIADYYVAPFGDVLRAAVPHGFGTSSKRNARLLLAPSDARYAEFRRRSPKRARIVDLLARHGTLTAARLGRATGLTTINGILNDMEREGLVATEELMPRPKVQVRMRTFVDVARIDAAAVQRALESLPPRRTKAREFLTSLLLLHGQQVPEADLLELLKRAGVSSSLVKPFVEGGLVPTTRHEVTRQQEYGTEAKTLTITLNVTQQKVYERVCKAVDEHTHRTFLLHGVTGSGKTQVYIEAIRHCVDAGKSAIVLVPEIALTPQIVRRFKTHFADRALVVHSRMSPGERYDVWRLAVSGACRVVIGPRSAIFAPLENLGLIVVDEEHEGSYKQFDAMPRYHARDVAIVRGRDCGAVVLLGSATPSVESYANAREGKFELLEMPGRVDDAVLPSVVIVDMTAERKRAYAARRESLPKEERQQLKQFRQSSLSSLLREKIADRLSKKEGIILLQNRRGFASFVECPDCGYVEMCDNCQVSLTYHLSQKHLRCHYCGHIRAPHTQCPACGSADIRLQGVGTQRVEEEIGQAFPEARVLRMDLDTTTGRGAHDRLLKTFGAREADILLGTQMVAKGLDFPHVTLVGVISADTQMLLPDFRSSERTFQLLTQVAGRAGRSTLAGEVIIQTAQPSHRTLVHILDHDYPAFFAEEYSNRQEVDYPPLSRLVLIEARAPEESDARALAEHVAAQLKRDTPPFTLLGPTPAVIGKINRQYRWQLLLKTAKSADPSGGLTHTRLRQAMAQLPSRAHSTQLIIDVDPVSTM